MRERLADHLRGPTRLGMDLASDFERELFCDSRIPCFLNMFLPRKALPNLNPSSASLAHWNSPRRLWQPLFVIVVSLILAVRLFDLVSQYAVNIFFSDQWEFHNATLFEKHSLWEMFRWQHGPHRQGLGALISYFLGPHFRWNSRTESFLIGGLVVGAAICGVWLKARLFHSVTLSDICIPLIFFNPRQIGQIFVVANWAHGPLPLLLVVLYCLSWTISNLVWRYGLVLAINFVTIYTGFGLFLGLVTPLAITADYLVNLKQLPRGKAYFAGALLISLVSFGSFFDHYGYAPEVACKADLFHSPASYMKFIFLMFANVVGAKGLGHFPTLAGAVLLACMLWALVVNCVKLRTSGTYFPRYLTAATLLLYPMLFSGIAAYGRSCLGFPEAQVSRYVMYLELGLLGLYISALAIRAGYLRVSLLLLLTLAFANTVRVLPSEQFEMEYYRRLKVDWKRCYVKYADIPFCDQFAGHWIYNEGGDEMLKGRLDYLQRTKQNLYSDLP